VILREVLELVRGRARVSALDPHELVLSDLGVTMADGGVEIDEQSMIRRQRGREGDADNPNIVRSEN
jgi:hypothetical protein